MSDESLFPAGFIFALVVVTTVIVGLIWHIDTIQSEKDTATCRSHGMEMTELRQGSGKTSHSVHICVNKDGQLYAF